MPASRPDIDEDLAADSSEETRYEEALYCTAAT